MMSLSSRARVGLTRKASEDDGDPNKPMDPFHGTNVVRGDSKGRKDATKVRLKNVRAVNINVYSQEGKKPSLQRRQRETTNATAEVSKPGHVGGRESEGGGGAKESGQIRMSSKREKTGGVGGQEPQRVGGDQEEGSLLGSAEQGRGKGRSPLKNNSVRS